jgi:hypothetical protein
MNDSVTSTWALNYASQTPVILAINGRPVATVTALPNNGGVQFPDGKTLKPTETPATTSGIVVSVNALAQIIFNYVNPITVVHSTPTISPNPSTSLVLSNLITSAPSTITPSPSPTNIETATSRTSIEASSKPTSVSPRKSTGVSSGAAAGIAIGCLIAGALVAGLILWFCWRKRRDVRPRDQEASKISLMPREKGFTGQATSLEGSPVVPALAGGLPQPLEDQAISGEVSKISSSIKNHVQSYYHADRVSGALIDHDDFQALGSERPISDGTLSTLLSNSATREIALRFCIAWVVCSRMQAGEDARSCLLPTEMAEFSRKLANTHGDPNGEFLQTLKSNLC